MKAYQTESLDASIKDCLLLDLKLRKATQSLVTSFELSESKETLKEIQHDYSLFKNQLLQAIGEIKINVLEIDNELTFQRYKKYFEIKVATLSNVMSPVELQNRLDEEFVNDISGTFFENFIICDVPEVLDYFHISSFIYTYSFFLTIYSNALLALASRLSFQGIDILDTAIFDRPIEPASRYKLKTILSVPQLAYLFNVLASEGLFQYKRKKDIYQFISENFSTKGIDDISIHSIKNKFESPEIDTLDYMQEKFIHFTQRVKKDKDNFGV